MLKKSTKKKPIKRKVLKNKPTAKIRLKYRNILVFFLIIAIMFVITKHIINIPIKNIYISGNTILSDQKVIEIGGIANYPASLKNTSRHINKRLLNNVYIKEAKVTKKGLSELHISILENKPLIYDSIKNQTILANKKEVLEKYNVPFLINYVPDTIYDEFLSNMNNINTNTLERISEIKYNPNEVDQNRFLLTMKDGNYVYLTLNKFLSINNYLDIIKNFNGKKGILYLDSGEYFEILVN